MVIIQDLKLLIDIQCILKKTGDTQQATELIEKILHKSKVSSKHFNALQKE